MVIAELTLPAQPDQVWRHLREPALISRWFGWEYEGLGHEIDVIFLQEVTVDDRRHVLDFGDGVESGDRFELEDLGVETLLRITRGAPDEGYDDITEGWITFLNQLRFALENHSGDPRHTLFYSGTGALSPMAELRIEARPAGTPYELDLIGQPVKGQVWYTSEHQLGLTVDAWGNGLLVLSHIPPGEQKPDGATMAILSVYGDVDRDALDARWRAWWEPRYPEQLNLGG